MIKQKNELKRLEENADRIKNIIQAHRSMTPRGKHKYQVSDSKIASTAAVSGDLGSSMISPAVSSVI
jgi:hypothetical protein